MHSLSDAITIKNLSVTYPGGIKALEDVSFTVKEQEIFGLLGPNGAGKTTLIMILTTLLMPTAGSAYVKGFDVTRYKNQVRMNLGYVSQDLSVDDELSGLDNLKLQAGLYHLERTIRKQRIDEVLDLVDLHDRARDRVETYSGGMRKRLDIACGLIHRPDILFLDEPTLGLDIQTRHEIWRYIDRLREEVGMTILLTTHYMDEADSLCQRIAIIDQGNLKVIDTPVNLKRQMGGEVIIFQFTESAAADAVELGIKRLKEQSFVREITRKNDDYLLLTGNNEESLPLFFKVLSGLPLQLKKVTLKAPSLDDVFLYHTGRQLRENNVTQDDMIRSRLSLRRIRKNR
ncbi:MAG TPA: ATP-binding cassette domain-containing protein [Candidatus Limnocylindrales bacterium]|nr:ATP-binding cassette domain-containing protein [Candidatus Limnocylindrales bacterium]